MNANELRVNNIVLYNDVELVISEYCETIILLSNIKGILLTEEWLLRFKFEGNKQPFTKYPFEIYIDDYNNCGFYFKGHCLSLFSYVHQLQNLYFAITGEEL